MKFSQMLIAYRQKHDLDQKSVADDVGISASTLSRLENGKGADLESLMKVMTWLFAPATGGVVTPGPSVLVGDTATELSVPRKD